MSEKEVDLIVIGGGPAGYIAAERAGEAGLSVVLFEEKALGGVCCNEGCIPTKSLLNSAKHLIHAQEASAYGVTVENISFNLSQAMEWKNNTVETLKKGIGQLMKKNRIQVIPSRAVLKKSGVVESEGELYYGKQVLLACGSRSSRAPIEGADSPAVVSSREVLELSELPESVAVIGGGVIGVEFASFFASVGVRVDLFEMTGQLIPGMDSALAKRLKASMKGVNCQLSARVDRIEGNRIEFTGKKGSGVVESDLILMAVGREAQLDSLSCPGLDIGPRGVIVDDRMQTSLPGVYAAGDVTGRSLLAHSAYRMAEVAVNNILGKEDRMRWDAIPWALYSIPEAAGCGLNEQQAVDAGYEVATATVPMRSNGRFLAENGQKAPGLCKLVADRETGRILGVHLMGTYCTEMIYGVSMLIDQELTVFDLRETIFPHPTVSEVIRDAAWNVEVDSAS